MADEVLRDGLCMCSVKYLAAFTLCQLHANGLHALAELRL